MWKRLAVAVVILLAIYAFLPIAVIDFLGKFAIGWMLYDIVNGYFETKGA